MTKKKAGILFIYIIWGAIITGMDLIFALERNMSYTLTIIELIGVSFIMALYLHIMKNESSWKIFQIDAFIATVTFLIVIYSAMARELLLLDKSLVFILVLLIPTIAMSCLGYLAYTDVQRKLNKDNTNVNKSKNGLLRTGIIPPIVACVYILNRHIFSNQTDSKFIVTWMILTLLMSSIFIFFYTIVALETRDKLEECF
ncbi:hypothetical protein [Pseudobutyrivibrio xylanivorans]|uniref:Uncharacterized protein n=1 Tax=Pseudobutyrivibrio xylanivorans TaxID=185007 RepID=A0A1G5S187_PSEXY|nr:hypothetical protein [Pseudobutyrivibrio xylanivorans]SCZ79501.1 hypothetical protein SAMN02910350_01804 [Pseudobutyrivibrio xylanivorans]